MTSTNPPDMALRPGPAYKFPWEDMGSFKYLLFVPFVATAALGLDDADNWAYHMLVIAAIRYVHAQFWISLSRIHAVTQHTKIQAKGIDYKQVDREDHWDDYIILQAIIMTLVHKMPYLGYNNFPQYNAMGMWQLLLLHAGPTEFIYYWLHRALHHHTLYSWYHSHHHASFVTEPITGSVHPFMEHIMYTANFAIPLVGTWAFGGASIAMFYAYLIGFDLLNNIGHCNFEFMPQWFMNIPGMKYLIYTPTYHSLHHSKVHVNFCLFMPIYDVAYGTNDPSSDELYRKAINGEAAPNKAPDVVFVAHGTELLSLFHLPFALRSFSSKPFKSVWWLQPFLPLCIPFVALLRIFGKPFTADRHRLLHLNTATWVTPAWGFQFFIKSEFNHINRQIERAILEADATGTKVIGLGALNKNEALNGGGQLFVDKHPNLRVRVVHGNTLTAAAILKKIPADVKEIFLTGSTSKLGRAIALYLSARGVKVVMYTTARIGSRRSGRRRGRSTASCWCRRRRSRKARGSRTGWWASSAARGSGESAEARHVPPVCRPAPGGVAAGLRVHRPPRVQAPQGGEGLPVVRDDHGAGTRARVPRGRARPRPRGVDVQRGGGDRSHEDRRHVGRSGEAWIRARVMRRGGDFCTQLKRERGGGFFLRDCHR